MHIEVVWLIKCTGAQLHKTNFEPRDKQMKIYNCSLNSSWTHEAEFNLTAWPTIFIII